MRVKRLARGRLLKTKVREAAKIAEAETKARTKAYIKERGKHFPALIQERLLKLIDNIDLIELSATLATTYVVHGIILTSAELFDRATNISQGLRMVSGTPEWVSLLPFADTPLGWTANIPFLINTLWDLLNQKEDFPQEQKEQIIEGATKILENPKSDTVYLWVLSYTIAYYVQKHGILNIFSAVQGFLGIKPV